MAGWLRLTVIRLTVIGLAMASLGASHQTPNFDVEAPTKEIARKVAAAAEESRVELAELWFGHELPRWSSRCRVTVVVGSKLGAGGSTKFRFDDGHVFGWRMWVQGSLVRILDSVIPHEVNHTILACYFRRPVPRWADEGAASLMEHASEQQHQIDLVNRLMNEGRRIPLRMLLNISQYPRDMKQVMALYAEGYSLTEYLLQRGGRKQFLRFLDDAHHRSWDKAIQSFYEVASIEKLEQDWSRWVLAGSPRLDETPETILASNERRRSAAAGNGTPVTGRRSDSNANGVVRSQTPDVRPAASHATIAPARTPGLARIIRSTSGRTSVRAPATSRSPIVAAGSARSRPALIPLNLTPMNSAAVTNPVSRRGRMEIAMPEQFPVPRVSAESAFGSRYRETHLRMQPEHRDTPRAGSWTQFPDQAGGRFRQLLRQQ